jgi:hypothetical protein
VFFQEEVTIYKDAATASKAFKAGKDSVSCTQGTTTGGAAITLSAPKDVSSSLGVTEAIEIDFQTTNGKGQLFAVHTQTGIVTFQFQAANGVDPSTLPDPIATAKKGMQRLGLS